MKVALRREIEEVPLSKSFPVPNYRKLLKSGIERWKVDALRALCDTIPMKPKIFLYNIYRKNLFIVKLPIEGIFVGESFMKIYSEEEIKKLDIEYNNLIPIEGIIWKEFAKKVNSINHKDKIYFQRKMVDDALNQYCAGYYIYPEKDNDFYSELKKIILNTIEHFPKEYYFWWCVYYYFIGDKKNLEKNLRDFITADKELFDENNFNEDIFVYNFLDLYKNAYSGFWKKLSEYFKKLKNIKAENLCNLFEDFYYTCKTYSEKENLLVNYIQKNPETILAKEFLGFIYGDMKLYYNGIQCLEQVKGKSSFFYYEDIYFQLAWYYGKVKEYSSEEENYRKCLEMNSEYMYALNNLGWSLYKQRKFDEAEKVFLKCIKENRDLPFPANNLVRIYIKTKQTEKAKKFIESKKTNVSKTLIERVKNILQLVIILMMKMNLMVKKLLRIKNL